ncbi:MAG: FAD-linked oxidase C-terminal domain-containing protein [Mycobacterium sp.]
MVQSGKGFFIGDVTVPRDRIPEMQEAIQATAARHADGLLFIAVCGHAGDGDLHPTTFFDKDNPLAASALDEANNEIIEAALSLGGTITGEHGVGTGKIQFMTKRFTPVEIAAQRSIKKAFDPYLDEHGVTCAAVPTTGGKRTVGELVATAAGIEREHIRHALLGADVTVIGNRSPARFGAETMKDVAGYDAKRLYISAGGAFGALTTLIFKIAVKA